MGINAVKNGVLRSGDLVFLNMLMLQIFGPLFNLGNIYRLWQDSFYELNEFLVLLSKEPKIQEIPNAVDLKFSKGEIEFKNVSYYYSTQSDEKIEMKKIISGKIQKENVVKNDKKSFVQKLISIFDKFIVFDKNSMKTELESAKKPAKSEKPEEGEKGKSEEKKAVYEYVMENFNLKIGGNEVVLITGVSGSGKTTLVSFLIRLLDPTKGTITIDGQDIKSGTLKSLRGGISFCPQNHYFFNDSFVNNIKFSHIDKYFDMQMPDDPKKQGDEYIKYSPKQSTSEGVDEEIFRHVKDFDLLSTVEAHEEGWDFIIGDNGDKLSGGQKQRLNLIRALLKDSSIYVFDEPTNFLDSINRQVGLIVTEGFHAQSQTDEGCRQDGHYYFA